MTVGDRDLQTARTNNALLSSTGEFRTQSSRKNSYNRTDACYCSIQSRIDGCVKVDLVLNNTVYPVTDPLLNGQPMQQRLQLCSTIKSELSGSPV